MTFGRKRFKSIGVAALGALALAACATATPYQPANNRGEGFAEFQLESNKFRVTFSGNTLTPLPTVENYLLYRAAEVTVNKGFDHFIVLEDKSEAMSTFRSFGTVIGGAEGRFFYGTRGFGGGFGTTTATTRERREYMAQAIIETGTGPKPADNPSAFNAREVLENLAPTIVRPEPKTTK
ncbi:MAG: hypothetical protein ACFB6R_17800 [Alphaproteobacteria bacterium]